MAATIATGRLYSVAEVAGLFGVSTRYVYRLIAERELPVVKLGRGAGDRNKLRVHAADLERWIEANKSFGAA